MRQTNQRGIAIGPILFVVAILAALASAIAAGSGAFNSDTSAIKAKAQAAAILEYADSVKTGVDRLLAKGCKDTEISFQWSDKDYFHINYFMNPNSQLDKSCHVFDVNGGGIVYKDPPEGTNKVYDEFLHIFTLGFIPYFAGGYAQIPNLSTNESELVLYLPINSIDLCKSINDILGISSIGIGSLYGCSECLPGFVGTYMNLYPNNLYPSTMSGCIKSNSVFPDHVSNAEYFFYKVLIAR